MADLLLSCRVVMLSWRAVVPAPPTKPLRRRRSSRLPVRAHEQRRGSECWDASCVRRCLSPKLGLWKDYLDCPVFKLNCSMPGSVSEESSSARERRSPIGVGQNGGSAAPKRGRRVLARWLHEKVRAWPS